MESTALSLDFAGPSGPEPWKSQKIREIFLQHGKDLKTFRCKIVLGSTSLMVLVCHRILGFDVQLSFKRARGHQLSDARAQYFGCLPVLHCLVPGTDQQGTLEEGSGTTK